MIDTQDYYSLYNDSRFMSHAAIRRLCNEIDRQRMVIAKLRHTFNQLAQIHSETMNRKIRKTA